MITFVLANGEGKRWGDHLGIQKYEIEIDGEKIIDRTIRLVRKYSKSMIVIVGDYESSGCWNYINKSKTKRELFQELTNFKEPFVMLNSDCYYTEEIIKDVYSREAKEWRHWCCPHENKWTGKPYGEGYVHRIYDVQWFRDKITEFNRLCDEGKIDMERGNDWIIQRFFYGIPLYEHNPNYISEYDVCWEDETDDFDYPSDYYRFLLNRDERKRNGERNKKL